MNNKIVLIVAIIAVSLGFLYLDTSNSFLGKLFEQFSSPNWDEIEERNIVKNSIPITKIDESPNGMCKVSAPNFDLIITHAYFTQSKQLEEDLRYDSDEKTLVIYCTELVGDTSKLEIWYATEEAKKHATKYEYFISEWVE